MYDIILPTYNEKENIRPLFYMINNVFKTMKLEYNIIMIDDNSPDGTYSEALKYKSKVNIKIIQRKEKLGLGSAYKKGLEHSRGEYIIIMDADLSHNPYDIKKMVLKMEEKRSDIVCGSRYLKNGQSGAYGWNFKRRLTSRGANNLAQLILGIECSDCTGSFRLYKKTVFESLLKNVKSSKFAYQMEVLYLAELNKFKIDEVPIVFCERIHGESKMGSGEIIYFLYIILYLFFRMS